MKLDMKFYKALEKLHGDLLGGCIDTFPMLIGTSIWPTVDEWKNKILFLETSEEKPAPQLIKYYLRGLGAQGILNSINGIILGKPQGNVYYKEYKTVLQEVLKELNLEYLPVMYNLNFGHNLPIGIIPYGIECELDLDTKKIK